MAESVTNPRLYRAAELTLRGASLPSVAADCGVSARTLSRWKASPTWRGIVAELSRRMLEDASDELRAASGQAVAVLVALLSDASPTVRLRAAVAILEQAGRCADADLEARLERLEGGGCAGDALN